MTCRFALYQNVRHIQAYGWRALQGTSIISAIEDNTNGTNLMTVEIFAQNDEEFNLTCTGSDTCKIACYHFNACQNLQLYCYGVCLVKCGMVNDNTCPNVKVGNYSLWISDIDTTTTNGFKTTSTTTTIEKNNSNINNKHNDNDYYYKIRIMVILIIMTMKFNSHPHFHLI